MGGKITPVILCGGAGLRLWPASNEAVPKPFLAIVDGVSCFAATLQRVADRQVFDPPLVVANRVHRHLIDEARAGAPLTVLLEPVARDTAAAVAAAAAWLLRSDPDAVMLVLAADHLIRDGSAFVDAALSARAAADAGAIVTFGVRPTMAATGYGYIRRATGPDGASGSGVVPVAAFVEKPDAATAATYVAAGYLWNSGNFLMRAATALAEMEKATPRIAEAAIAAVSAAVVAGNVVELAEGPFSTAPALSFDRAVMEKTAAAAVLEAGFDWSDLGTWSAVWEASDKDAEGNAVRGEVVLEAAHGNYVSSDRPIIGVVGVSDLVIVASDDAVLVASLTSADAIKALAGAVGKKGERRLGGHARHYRPWGYYQSLDLGETHQVKRLVVNPGGRLSLQKHRHRAEHWTVVSGVAETTVDGDTRILNENQSVFIPLGAVHRLANPGKVPMTLIEVQYGDYLGEDDIIRIEDDYSRTPG